MLNKIRKPSIIHKMPNDIRHHSFGVSRIVYFIILIAIAVAFLNYVFYPLYLLVGDAFVDSDAKVISFPYDTKIDDIYVENGDTIKEGQDLFSYDSTDFRFQLLNAINNYSEIIKKKQNIEINIERYKALIKTSDEYLSVVGEAKENLEELKKKGNTTIDRVITEKTREFTAYRDYMGYKAELDASYKAMKELQEVIELSQKTLKFFINDFNRGIEKSPVNGVIGNLLIQPGTTIKKTESVLKVYYGKRYLSVLFEDSFVSKKEGDPVIVSFNDGSNYCIGIIVDIGGFTQELPDEIKPRYKAPGRRAIARVLIDESHLKSQEILATGKIYKPLGLSFICSIFQCGAGLKGKYQEYLNEREMMQKTNKAQHMKNNDYFFQAFSKEQPLH